MTLAEYICCAGERPAAFARRAGLAKSTISRLLRGQCRPSWEVVAKIHEVTDGFVTANDWAAMMQEVQGDVGDVDE